MRVFLACAFFNCFVILNATPKAPSNPYSFYAPDFSRMLPFSDEDLKLFRQEKIKRIETEAEGFYGEFYFNDKGQLFKERSYVMNRKKKVFTDSTFYRYNEKGLLIALHSRGETQAYDSMDYDGSGRVIYYLSYMTGGKGSADKDVFFDLKLEKKEGDLYHLVNTADTIGKTVFVLNNSNQVVKCVNRLFKGSEATRIDSVAWLSLNNREYCLKYYWKDEGKPYQVGQEYCYRDGLLRSYIQFESQSPDITTRHTHYTYSEDGRLMQVMELHGQSDKILFSYNSKGLLQEEITLNKNYIALARYRYFY